MVLANRVKCFFFSLKLILIVTQFVSKLSLLTFDLWTFIFRSSPSLINSLEGNKYKLLMRFALENIDIAKGKYSPNPMPLGSSIKIILFLLFWCFTILITALDNDNHFKKTMKEIENLKSDMSTLNQVIDLISNLKCSHQVSLKNL